ncbi:MAG: cytochrome c oxidase subunit 3 [Maribacter sp.]|jgi:cytochrome c oxidase subunit 3
MMAQPVEYENTRSKVHPKKFMLWVSIGSLCMMFAAFTSFYLVRQASGNWLEFELPSAFYISTAIIILSSITVHLSYWFFKRMNTLMYRSLLLLTLILGCVFVGLQYEGWLALNQMGVYLDGNASGATVIVISALHAAHVLGGIGVLILANIHAFVLPHKVTNARKLRFELTYTYWHFVDILWIYLLFFFVTQ